MIFRYCEFASQFNCKSLRCIDSTSNAQFVTPIHCARTSRCLNKKKKKTDVKTVKQGGLVPKIWNIHWRSPKGQWWYRLPELSWTESCHVWSFQMQKSIASQGRRITYIQAHSSVVSCHNQYVCCATILNGQVTVPSKDTAQMTGYQKAKAFMSKLTELLKFCFWK